MPFRQVRTPPLRWAMGLALALACGSWSAGAAEEVGSEIAPIQFAELAPPARRPDDGTDGSFDMLRIPDGGIAGGSGAAVEILPGSVLPEGTPSADHFTGAVEHMAPPPLLDVSSRAADGMRVDDFELDEMPFPASSGEWFRSGRWYGSAESLWFSRSRNYRRQLGRDVTIPNPTGRNKTLGVFTTTALPFDLVPGGRFTLGESIGRDYLDRDQFLEMTYYGGFAFFQQDYWNALPGSYLVTPLDPEGPGFFGAQNYATTINSVFNSMEWNYKLRRRLGRDQLVMSPNGEWSQHAERGWLAGLTVGTRVANVNEEFSFTSRRTNVPLSQYSGDYRIWTQNWLWGLNLGGELRSQNEFYYWGIRGAATPALSFAANQQAVASVNRLSLFPPDLRGAVNRRDSAQQLGPGFVGDLGLFAGWQVTPNFSIKAGYDFLWVAGIATATRQFNLNNVRPHSIDGGGQVFYNGVSVGCDGSW